MTATATPDATRTTHPNRPGPRIVVGVDGSPGSSAALTWALREARLRDTVVDAVFAWQYHPSLADPELGTMFPLGFGVGLGPGVGLPPALRPDVPGGGDAADQVMAGGEIATEDAMRDLLDAAISDAVAADRAPAPSPRRRVERRTAEGHPVDVLLAAVSADDLLVVGSHGHGYLAGALLGSVSQRVVAHAPCPVVVVPDRAEHPTHRQPAQHESSDTSG